MELRCEVVGARGHGPGEAEMQPTEPNGRQRSKGLKYAIDNGIMNSNCLPIVTPIVDNSPSADYADYGLW